MWVPLIEANEHDKPGANYFVEKHIKNIFSKSGQIDTLLLACTHYPLLQNKIRQLLPESVTLLSQGQIVADSLAGYLTRHPEIDQQCSKNGRMAFFTTDSTEDFDNHASTFFGQALHAEHVDLEKSGLL